MPKVLKVSFAQYVTKNSIIRHFLHHEISQDFRCQYQVLYSNLVWWLIAYYWLIYYNNKSLWPKFFKMSLHHFYSTAPMSSNWQRSWSSLRPEAAVIAVCHYVIIRSLCCLSIFSMSFILCLSFSASVLLTSSSFSRSSNSFALYSDLSSQVLPRTPAMLRDNGFLASGSVDSSLFFSDERNNQFSIRQQ